MSYRFNFTESFLLDQYDEEVDLDIEYEVCLVLDSIDHSFGRQDYRSVEFQGYVIKLNGKEIDKRTLTMRDITRIEKNIQRDLEYKAIRFPFDDEHCGLDIKI